MAPRRPPPLERVRARLEPLVGRERAGSIRAGYQRLGRVLIVRVPPELWAYRAELGRAWCSELGVETVLARTGAIEGELREPSVERIAGTSTVTEVIEHGVRWRFDAARLMFAAGNRTERRRAGLLVQPGERVADLFAGIGYFAIPAARRGPSVRVVAVEKNPVSFGFLVENARLNGVADRVDARLGDNREVELPLASFERLFLGWLPDSTPGIDRAIELAVQTTAHLHVHRVADVRDGLTEPARQVDALVARAGRTVRLPSRAREVKPYGPGRRHVVVDVELAPR